MRTRSENPTVSYRQTLATIIERNTYVTLLKKITMIKHKIEFLPEKDFKILKVIEIIGPNWNRFNGYLSYLRNFDKENYESGDILDEKILSTIKQTMPLSYLRLNEKILFKDQLEEIQSRINMPKKMNLTIQLFPLIPNENIFEFAGKEFNAYPYNFNINIIHHEKNDYMSLIHNYLICNIPHDIIDDISKTIKPL